jgi:hypothetical protein
MKTIIAITMFLFLVSCAPNYVLVNQYQKDDAAILKFYCGSSNDIYVVVDNETTGVVPYDNEVDVRISPGEHVLQVFSSAAGILSVPIRKNFSPNIIYYMSSYSPAGGYGIFLSEVNEAEFKKLKEASKNLTSTRSNK